MTGQESPNPTGVNQDNLVEKPDFSRALMDKALTRPWTGDNS